MIDDMLTELRRRGWYVTLHVAPEPHWFASVTLGVDEHDDSYVLSGGDAIEVLNLALAVRYERVVMVP